MYGRVASGRCRAAVRAIPVALRAWRREPGELPCGLRAAAASTFVSSHFRMDPSAIGDLLDRRAMPYRTTPTHYQVRACPLCAKPHHDKADNLFKLYIRKADGSYFCHRCGTGGSWWDFLQKIGALPGTTPAAAPSAAGAAAAQPFARDGVAMGDGAGRPPNSTRGSLAAADADGFGDGDGVMSGAGAGGSAPPQPSSPAVDVAFCLKARDDLLLHGRFPRVLHFLTVTRGIKEETLWRYCVGAVQRSFPVDVPPPPPPTAPAQPATVGPGATARMPPLSAAHSMPSLPLAHGGVASAGVTTTGLVPPASAQLPVPTQWESHECIVFPWLHYEAGLREAAQRGSSAPPSTAATTTGATAAAAAAWPVAPRPNGVWAQAQDFSGRGSGSYRARGLPPLPLSLDASGGGPDPLAVGGVFDGTGDPLTAMLQPPPPPEALAAAVDDAPPAIAVEEPVPSTGVADVAAGADAGNAASAAPSARFPALDMAGLVCSRVKLRSITDKSKQTLLPRGNAWGLFGWHTLGPRGLLQKAPNVEGGLAAASGGPSTGNGGLKSDQLSIAAQIGRSHHGHGLGLGHGHSHARHATGGFGVGARNEAPAASAGDGVSDAASLVLTEGELDALSVYQATGIDAVSLPNGCRSLPVAVLPWLEPFERLHLWLDDDLPGREGAEKMAAKLGSGRCLMVRPQPSLLVRADGAASEPPALASPLGLPKDANEFLLKGFDLRTIIAAARQRPHEQILSVDDVKGAVLREYEARVYDEMFGVSDADGSGRSPASGVPFRTLPALQSMLKGHRPGEMTIVTGPTGSGKTTLLTQLSLDLCAQGVVTLWGSFEIKVTRMIAVMIEQMRGGRIQLPRGMQEELLRAAEAAEAAEAAALRAASAVAAGDPRAAAVAASVASYAAAADVLSRLPLNFLRFYGSSDVDSVIEALTYAVYAQETEHVLIDNLQFMMSTTARREAADAAAAGGYRRAPTFSSNDKFELQERAIEKFRLFATKHNVHITLVVHPRKESEDAPLNLSSVFGSAKATQEADSVWILQRTPAGKKYLDVKKNRYDGELGVIPLAFDTGSRCFYEPAGAAPTGSAATERGAATATKRSWAPSAVPQPPLSVEPEAVGYFDVEEGIGAGSSGAAGAEPMAQSTSDAAASATDGGASAEPVGVAVGSTDPPAVHAASAAASAAFSFSPTQRVVARQYSVAAAASAPLPAPPPVISVVDAPAAAPALGASTRRLRAPRTAPVPPAPAPPMVSGGVAAIGVVVGPGAPTASAAETTSTGKRARAPKRASNAPSAAKRAAAPLFAPGALLPDMGYHFADGNVPSQASPVDASGSQVGTQTRNFSTLAAGGHPRAGAARAHIYSRSSLTGLNRLARGSGLLTPLTAVGQVRCFASKAAVAASDSGHPSAAAAAFSPAKRVFRASSYAFAAVSGVRMPPIVPVGGAASDGLAMGLAANVSWSLAAGSSSSRTTRKASKASVAAQDSAQVLPPAGTGPTDVVPAPAPATAPGTKRPRKRKAVAVAVAAAVDGAAGDAPAAPVKKRKTRAAAIPLQSVAPFSFIGDVGDGVSAFGSGVPMQAADSLSTGLSAPVTVNTSRADGAAFRGPFSHLRSTSGKPLTRSAQFALAAAVYKPTSRRFKALADEVDAAVRAIRDRTASTLQFHYQQAAAEGGAEEDTDGVSVAVNQRSAHGAAAIAAAASAGHTRAAAAAMW